MPQIKAEHIAEVRELIAAKQYGKAREILSGFDDPQAKKALARLNQSHPQLNASKKTAGRQKILFGGVFIAIVLALMALVVALIGLKRQQDAYQPLEDLFNATPLPTWTLPYTSPVTAMEWVCHGTYEKSDLSESALVQACQKEAALLYQTYTAEVDACYTAHPDHLDFLECAIDQDLAFLFDGRYIEAAK